MRWTLPKRAELPGPCVGLLASDGAGSRAVAAFGLKVGLARTPQAALRHPVGLYKALMDRGIRDLVAYSQDWRYQPSREAYAMAMLPAIRHRLWLCDGTTGLLVRYAKWRVIVDAASAIVSVPAALILISAEFLRSLAAWRSNRGLREPTGSPGRSVVAIWRGGSGANVGGSVSHISGILQGFRSHGYETVVITAYDPVPSQLQDSSDTILVLPPVPRLFRAFPDSVLVALNRQFRRYVRTLADGRDIAFIYQRNVHLLDAGVDIASSLSRPLVVEWNGSEVWTREHWTSGSLGGTYERAMLVLVRLLQRRVLSAAAVVASVSNVAGAGAAAAGAAQNKIVLVPNAVSDDDLGFLSLDDRDAGGLLNTQHPVVGWIGSFGPWHGAEILVRAAAILQDDTQFVMIGDGSERSRTEELALDLGVSDRFIWRGSLPHASALQALARCDILASPHVPLPGQRFFGSPTKLFEYMAIGRPIVASALEQIGEVLEDGRSGVLVTPGDPQALADGIRRVLKSADRGASLGREARSDAMRYHTWSQRAETILSRLLTNDSGDRCAV